MAFDPLNIPNLNADSIEIGRECQAPSVDIGLRNPSPDVVASAFVRLFALLEAFTNGILHLFVRD